MQSKSSIVLVILGLLTILFGVVLFVNQRKYHGSNHWEILLPCILIGGLFLLVAFVNESIRREKPLRDKKPLTDKSIIDSDIF